MIGTSPSCRPPSLRHFVASATDHQLDEVLKAFNDGEDEDVKRRAFELSEERIAADTARRAAPLTEEERAEVDAENDRRRQIAERENSTEARLSRLEALLERVATSLDKR